MQVVSNENIPGDFLYDNKHLRKKNKIGALVSNLKDAIFNRVKKTRNGGVTRQRSRNTPSTQTQFSSVNIRPKPGPVRKYTQVVTSATPKPPEVPQPQPQAASSLLDMNTVLGLLKLYHSMQPN